MISFSIYMHMRISNHLPVW